MASPWDGREEAMTSEGEGAGWRVEVGQTHHGRLSLVLCHECQTLHYQLHCRTSSRLAGTVTAGDSPSCRNSVSWEEFFGSSLELAPSLLSIYDNLAASSANDDNDFTGSATPSRVHQDQQTAVSQSRSCVTAAYPGFWITDPDSHHRLFVTSCRDFPGERPVSLMVMEPPGDGDRDKVKKRPLSVSSLSSLSSTSPQRVQRKRPNLSEDGEESCSDLPSHTSSDSNLTGPASDRLSLTSDRESLTSDPVSLTSDRESLTSDSACMTSDSACMTSDSACMTSDSACMTSDRVSMASVANSGVTTTTVPLKRVASATDERGADTAEDVDGGTGPAPAMAGRSVVPLDAWCGGQLEPPGPSRKSSGVSAGGRSSGGSLSTSPSLQPDWLAMAAVGADVGHQWSSHRTTTPSSPSLGRSAATDTSVPQATPSPRPSPADSANGDTSSQQTTPSHRPSPADSANGDTSSQQTTPPATPLRVSCVGEVAGGQPVVMKPLQTTIRPVPITIPDSIRKPHCSSGSVKDEVSVACGRQVSVEGVACGRQVSAEGALRSRQSSESSGTLTPPSPLRGGSVAASSASAAAVGPVKSVLSTLEAATAGSRQDFAGSRTTGARSSVLTADSVSSVGVRSGRGVHVKPVSRVSGTAPPAPGQEPKVSELSCSSPLSPTAMARRRFLASHFDIPDVSPQEPPQDCGAQDWGAEQPAAPADSSAVSVSSGRSSSLAVPSSLPFPSNTDTSPVTSRSDSPGSAVQSPSGDSLNGTEAGTTRSFPPTPSPGPPSPPSPPSPTSPPQSLPAGQSASTPTAAPTATATAAPSRIRSQRKAEGGGVSVRGGSVKGGTYVTYAQRVVTELVDTERLYVNSLQAIITGYKQQLESLLSGRDSGRQDLACLFCNITDIFSFSKVFLCDLEQCGVDPVKVAECFVRHNTGFVIYTDYCTNYPRAVEVLTRFMQDAELSEVCKACQVSLGHGLPLGAYLLRPVQRILKYHLLLQNILKNSDESRAGYDLLEKALGHMTDMAHHINEMKRRHEHAVRIQEVQSQLEDYAGEDLTRLGELVLEGSFRVYGAKASRQVFLFERGIVISKKKEAGMLACKAFVPCSNLMLVEVIPSEPLSFHIIPFDNPRAQHTLQARSMEQKRHWCQEIKRLILESYKGRIPDNVKSLVMELGRNHDNDYVGKDAHDSPWKHQHTAPEYLEKRRFRRKSGGKVPDIVPLLKFPRGAVKRDPGQRPATGNKSKSPKVWRKSDSPLSSGSRERAESVPMMQSAATSSSLPVLGVSSSLSCQSLRPDTNTTAHKPPDTTAHQPPDTTAHQPPDTTSQQPPNTTTHQPPPQPIADGNNNHDKNPAAFPGSSAVAATCPGAEAEGTRAESVRKRAASFKRAVRHKPLSSHDLSDGLPDEDAAPDDDPSRGKADEEPGAGSQRLHAPDTQRQQRRQSRDDDDTASSPSGDDDSSDAERVQRPQRRRRGGGRGGVAAAMYGSMPALNSLERRPAQKRRSGETKSGMRRKADVWKSSDSVAGREDGAGTARPYRRHWEGEGATLQQQQQRKVPALHDAYGRRCREALVRKKGLGASCGATLTDWGSVDKLTHGSLADLSHLKENPWVKKDPPNQTLPSPRATDAPAALTPTPALGVHTRSHSVSLSQSKDWNPQDGVPGPGRPRNNSDVTEVMRRSGKENLDWMVYVNRNSGDQDIRERADSLSKPSGRSRAASGDSAVKALCDSNSTISVRDSNISRSVSLCQDTLKRYSLEMPDRKKLPGDGEVSPRGLTSEDVVTTSADKPKTPSSTGATLTSVDADVEMTDVTQASGKGGDVFPTAGSPATPRPRSNVHQLLSPTPFSPTPLSAAPFFPTPLSPALRDKARVTPTSRSQPPQGPPSAQRASSQGGQSHPPISSQPPPVSSQPPPVPTEPPPTAADPPSTLPHTPPTPADPPPLPSQAPPTLSQPPPTLSQPPPTLSQPPPTLSQPPPTLSQPPPTLSQPPPTLSQPPPCSRRWAQRTVSAQTATLSAEGERLVAEMERYYEAHSPGTPTLTCRFPPSQDTWRAHSPQPDDGDDDSPALHQETNANQDNTAGTDRLSGVSSVSSSNDGCAGHFHLHLLHPWRDVNPNRLSGTSSISTSSFDSQNSSSSESVVGALKSKLSAWTLKLGGRRSREEDASDPRDSLTSPASLPGQADLQHVLREHSLGSPHIGLRMANTLPVGFEPLLSPPAGTRERASSGKLSGKEGSGEPHGRFSFPSAVPERSKAAEALGASRPVQQSDSGISVRSAQSGSAGVFSHGANALPDDPDGPQYRGDGEDVTQRRDSASSSSGDSFYERRLSVAFESGLFQEQDAPGQQRAGPQSPEGRRRPRRSIREVVQYIEEKFRPRQPAPVEVRRKEPSALIRQRLQSLRDNASYRCGPASRSHSEDRGRERDSTPDSPRLARPQQRSRSANQFMHRVQLEPVVGRDSREGEQASERERELAAKTERETALGRERETAWRVPEPGWESEEKREGGGSSGVNALGSGDRLDQQSSEVDNLVIMRGWVRNLINKFQQIS